MKQLEINEFLEDNDFCGVFRNKIAGWYDSRLRLNLEVYIVTAKENTEGVSCYEEGHSISGSEYEVHHNGKVYKRTFSSDVTKLVRVILEEYKETEQ